MRQIARHALVLLPLAALLVAAPVQLNGGKLMSYDSAFAERGGNGNGGGNGKGGGASNGGNSASNAGNSAGNGASASANAGSNGNHGQGNNGQGNGGQGNNGKGDISSQLGALNAGHASTKALANASTESRVGKIAAYKSAAEAAVTAGDKAAAAIAASDKADADLAAAQQELDALKADPNADLTDAQAKVDALAKIAAEAQAAEDKAKADAVAATKAEMDALIAAANKTPVSPETKDALDALLAGN